MSDDCWVAKQSLPFFAERGPDRGQSCLFPINICAVWVSKIHLWLKSKVVQNCAQFWTFLPFQSSGGPKVVPKFSRLLNSRHVTCQSFMSLLPKSHKVIWVRLGYSVKSSLFRIVVERHRPRFDVHAPAPRERPRAAILGYEGNMSLPIIGQGDNIQVVPSII